MRPPPRVGGSAMRSEVVDGQWRWHLTLDEPGLWRGRTSSELTFTLAGEPLTLPSVAETNADAATASTITTGLVSLPVAASKVK